MWSIDGLQGNESAKIKWELVPYTRGRVLEIGCGTQKCFQHFIGIDNEDHAQNFGWQTSAANIRGDGSDLSLFNSESVDAVFSSHMLEHLEYPGEARNALIQWLRVIKIGGYLILYLPDKSLYPNVGEPGANPTHHWDPDYESVIELMKETGYSWDLERYELRDQGIEYSGFYVFRKIKELMRTQSFSWKTKEKPAKTCAVVRYGGFGDAIQASSILPWLKEQGYHITFYCTDMTHQILRHEPNIDRFIIQDRDQVPNHELHNFWDYEAKKYDKWINLSESVEGTLLAIPERASHKFSKEARHRLMNVNYLEFTHEMAGVPLPPRQRFISTAEELCWADEYRKSIPAKKVVLWSLAGSSVNKTWPWLDQIIARLMMVHKDTAVILVGDNLCQLLEAGWEEEPRVICASGKLTMRQSITLCHFVDVVCGTETGLLNAAGLLDVAKVVTLSHSTEENLTKYWKNTWALSAKTDCYPCHQLHYGWDHCREEPQYGVAQCQYDISAEQFYEALRAALIQRREDVEAK